MWFWDWLVETYVDEHFLLVMTAIAALALLIAATAGFLLRSTGVYAALSATIVGVVGLIVIFKGAKTAGYVSFSLLLTLVGIVYLLLFFLLSVRKSIRERKAHRAKIQRRLQYTLPDRENSYVRARLNTALHIDETELNADMGSTEMKKSPLKLEYARRLMDKVKEAPLTAAERLQTEEMAKTFSLYLKKESWGSGDIHAINELCAALLKLSAKYAV